MARTYSQTEIANIGAPQIAEAIDLSSTDFDPGYNFVVYVDDTASGAAVKVDTANGDTITFSSATEATRLGADKGLICSKVYRTGTTADILFAFRA